MTSNQRIQEHVLSTFAYHCGEIMANTHIKAFCLSIPNGIEVCVSMKVVSYDSNDVRAWDQIEVNGVFVGNRSAARDEYARLCAPVIAAAFAV